MVCILQGDVDSGGERLELMFCGSARDENEVLHTLYFLSTHSASFLNKSLFKVMLFYIFLNNWVALPLQIIDILIKTK